MTDVIVVGGGLIGLASAYFLRRAGLDVRLLEARHIAAGASYGNCGLVTPSHASPLTRPGMVRQGLASLLREDAAFRIAPTLSPRRLAWLLAFARHCTARHWRHALAARLVLLHSARRLLAEVIEREGLVVEWQARGTYTAYLDPLLFERERQVHDEMAEFGVRFEVLDRLALRRRIPTLRADVVGGIYAPDDAFLRPDALCRAWLAANRRLGVEICEGVRVEMLRPQDDGIELDTDRGVERASRVILALGAWSRALADRLGVRLPIEPGKGYSITLPKPVGASDEAILLKDVSVCYTPWSNQIRLGSTMEFTGFDPRLNAVRLEALRRGAGRFLSLTWGPESGEAWCGFRPMVYDELPIIGALPRERRVVVAAGHGMLGLSMSAATGRLAAELLLGAEPHVDPTPYRLERFT